MHALRFPRRRLQHTLWVMLVAWLFALGMGVVNACVVATPAVDGHRVAAHASSVDHHGHGDATGKTSCLKFCDDESSALSKGDVSAPDLGVPLFAVLSTWPSIIPITAVGTWLALDRPIVQGPPLVIRFLRLTL
jgi:hypothetical protein